MTMVELIDDLMNNGFEIIDVDDLDENLDSEIIDYMNDNNLQVLLSNSFMARFWYFKNLDSMKNYFDNGGKVGYENHADILG